MERMEFIATIKPFCLATEATYGIPWGWLVAQAIQESGGYGKSDLSINAHNLYGIKGRDYYQGTTGYAKFADWGDAIEFQGWQLNQSRYLPFKPLVVAGKFQEYGNAISKAGWCPWSDPSYGQMIAQLAADYDLYPDGPVTWGEKPLSVAQQWVVSEHIFNDPVDWTKQVDYNTLAWALYKARGRV